MVPPLAYAPMAGDVHRPPHQIAIQSRTMEYQRHVLVREWRWYCECGAVGAWDPVLARVMTDADAHLRVPPGRNDG